MKIFIALARNKTLELTMILHISEKKISCFFLKKNFRRNKTLNLIFCIIFIVVVLEKKMFFEKISFFCVSLCGRIKLLMDSEITAIAIIQTR